jgi:ATP-dependent RNA helicase DeaD
MKTFSDFQLPTTLADSLNTLGFTSPTPIQAQAIPHALEGRDILGSAQTGTGKTAAFMIPLITRLLNDPTAKGIVMTPTRELATQVADMTRKLIGQSQGIRTALLIGGEPMPKQYKQLSNRPRLIIGTPGRIDDHCRRNRDLLSDANFLVLDEADRMLDMGFSVQIDSILKYMTQERQTLLFSATFAGPIVKFAQRYLNNPVRVEIKADKITADKIKHDIVHTTIDRKFEQLQSELSTREGSVIIFVKTRRNADQLAKRLCYIEHADFHAEPIHGDLRQRQRDRTIKDFRSAKFRILVATDVASRGLDIPHIEHVINYDLPQNPEDYVHRIGRTARAGAEGQAICLLTPQDGRNWSAIQRLVFPNQAPIANSNFERDSKPRRSGGGNRFQKGGERNYAKKFDKGAERSSFKKREDRFEDRAFGDKKRSDKPFERRSFDKKREDRPFGDKSRSDKPFEKRSFDKKREDRPFGDKSRSDKPFEKRSFDKKREDRPFGDKPRSDKPFEKRSFGDKKRNDRPSGDRPFKKREEFSGNRYEHNEGRADNPKNQRFNGERQRPKFDGPNREGRPEGKKQGHWNGPKKKTEGQNFNGDRPFKAKRNDQGGFSKDRPAQKTHRLKSRGPKRAA